MRKADLLLEVSPSSDWCLLPTRLLWWLGRLEGLHQKSWYDKQTSKVSASRFAHASMCMCACLSASVKWCFIQSQSFESPLESQPMHLLVERSKEVKKYDKTSIDLRQKPVLHFELHAWRKSRSFGAHLHLLQAKVPWAVQREPEGKCTDRNFIGTRKPSNTRP